VYLGGVVLLQQVVGLVTGRQSSQLAVVASTAIAALFQPLRRRNQAAIDRRFYRRKYDAQRAPGTFGARLRDGTDLKRLSADLLATVEETLQPAHATLWLRSPAPIRVPSPATCIATRRRNARRNARATGRR
jgi:hypothetical protein